MFFGDFRLEEIADDARRLMLPLDPGRRALRREWNFWRWLWRDASCRFLSRRPARNYARSFFGQVR